MGPQKRYNPRCRKTLSQGDTSTRILVLVGESPSNLNFVHALPALRSATLQAERSRLDSNTLSQGVKTRSSPRHHTHNDVERVLLLGVVHDRECDFLRS